MEKFTRLREYIQENIKQIFKSYNKADRRKIEIFEKVVTVDEYFFSLYISLNLSQVHSASLRTTKGDGAYMLFFEQLK